ncbi:MAG: RNA polymerase sigma factor [Myxococcales bacterium]|nr:RNA polymerase sigma factor [Myxococcales bacterium]
MVQSQAGDQGAYERLLGEISRLIEGHCRRVLGASAMVDDCVQECLITLHKARRTYDPARRFIPWMLAVVRHKTIDVLRAERGKSRREIPSSDWLEGAGEPAADPLSTPPVDPVPIVRDFLPRLPEPYRRALILTKLEGCSTQEAANRLGIGATALRVRVHRAMRMARKLIDEDLQAED